MARALTLAVLVALLGGCGGSSAGAKTHASASHTTSSSSGFVRWRIATSAPEPVDLSVPRSDGRLTLAADGKLFLYAPPGRLTPFARGRHGYTTRLGLEPYIALTPSVRLPASGCSFSSDDLFALQPYGRLGVIRITPSGQVSRFASLPSGGLPDGITYDQVGDFGHRLLVTEEFGPKHASVFAFDCRGRRTTVARTVPRLEGGITVAPTTFGAYAGRLIAANEYNGHLIDISASGQSGVLAISHLHFGPDTGVESTGFVPAGRVTAAYVSDRYTAHHRYLGDNAILELTAQDLRRAGVRPGDLLAATEGGGLTDDVRCAASCTVRYVAIGTPRAYIEGHIEFAAR